MTSYKRRHRGDASSTSLQLEVTVQRSTLHAVLCIEAADRDEARRAEIEAEGRVEARRAENGGCTPMYGKDQADRERSDLSACLE